MKRLFVVGCSRSGTTVMQRELCESLSLYSLPETAFFEEQLATPARRLSALRRLGVAMTPQRFRRDARRWRMLRETVGYGLTRLGPTGFTQAVASRRAAARQLVRQLDAAAEACGMQGWIEKTPLHCLRIDQIRELVHPDGFVFVVRGGQENAASIRDRAIRYPRAFGHQRPLFAAAALWNETLEAAQQQLGRDDVYCVSYESFAEDPHSTMHKIAQRFGLNEADSRAAGAPMRLYGEEEGWKRVVAEPVRPQPSKWNDVFDEEERVELLRRLQIDRYRELMCRLQEDPRLGIAAPRSALEGDCFGCSPAPSFSGVKSSSER